MKLSLRVTRHTTASELVHLGNFFTALGLNRGAHVFAPPTDPAELEDPEVVFAHPSQAHDLRTGEVGTIDTGINILTGKPEPKRKRRTKAEIEAEIAAREAAAAGPFYWSHPESDSFGIVQTREELNKTLASDMCCVEVTAEQYAALVEAAKPMTQPEEVAAAEAAEAALTVPVGNDDPAPTQPVQQPDTPPSETASTAPVSASPSSGKTFTAADVQQLATVIARTHGADLVKGKIAELGGARIADLKGEQLNALGDFLENVK